MVPAGQRAAQSPQRMQRVSSFNMTEPAMTPSSSALMSSSSTPSRSRISASWPVVASSKAMRSSETSSRQFSGQTSTQPPHKMQEVASSRVAFKDGIDPAVKASLRFCHGGFFVESDLDFSDPGAAIEGQHGNRRPHQVEQIRAACDGAQAPPLRRSEPGALFRAETHRCPPPRACRRQRYR